MNKVPQWLENLQSALARHVRIPSSPRLWLPGRTTPIVKRRSVFMAHSWLTGPDGKVLWAEPAWVDNILHDEGEAYMLVCSFVTNYGNGFPAGAPSNLYMGLDDRSTLAENNTLTTVSSSEVSGGAYARKAVPTTTSGVTLSQDAGDYRVEINQVTFTASGGNFSQARNRFITTAASGTTGKLISSLALNQAQTVLDGSSLGVNLRIKLSE